MEEDMRAGLKLQFILLTITLVVVTVFGSSYFFTRQQRDILIRETTRRGTTIARNLATISTDFLITNDNLALATYVDSVTKNEGVMYSMILDEKGTILAHNRIENVGKAYLEPSGVRPLTNEEVLIQPYENKNGVSILDIASPIRLRNGVRIGTVHIGMSQRAIDRLVNQTFRDSLSIAAGLLIIGIIISILVTNMMLKPVGELMREAKALGEGNLDRRIKIKGRSELAVLGKTFNEMAAHLKELYIGVLRAMAKALESRDKFSAGHDQRVAEYAAICAGNIRLSKDEVENIRLAAQVQNLGHIAVPDAIMGKTGRLTTEEYEKLKEHPVIGADILSQIKALRGTVSLVLHHHERFDGRGYPKGLKGKQIPLGARILAVADAYDAMISVRRHREAISRSAALEEIKKGAGTQFDPEIVRAFIETLNIIREGINHG
ncbi:HD domain-containing protein [bacterium]|nr:HD domain-containing protein [bacterium]